MPSLATALLTALLGLGFSGWADMAPMRKPIPCRPGTNGAAKKSIIEFVARVTSPGGADFVPAEQRIATFDNTARSGASSRSIQVAFAFERPHQSAGAQHPEWRTKQPIKACLDKDMKALGGAR